MNRRIAVAALAGAVVSGLVVVVLPQHATSIVRVGASTVTAIAAALVIAAVAPVVAREPTTSALDHVPTPGASPLDPQGLRDARRDIDRPTAPGSVPSAVRRRLVEALRVRGLPDERLPAILTDEPRPGSGRDAPAVSQLVNEILDAAEQGTTHGHH